MTLLKKPPTNQQHKKPQPKTPTHRAAVHSHLHSINNIKIHLSFPDSQILQRKSCYSLLLLLTHKAVMLPSGSRASPDLLQSNSHKSPSTAYGGQCWKPPESLQYGMKGIQWQNMTHTNQRHNSNKIRIYTRIFNLYKFWILCFLEGKNNNRHKQRTHILKSQSVKTKITSLVRKSGLFSPVSCENLNIWHTWAIWIKWLQWSYISKICYVCLQNRHEKSKWSQP